LAIPQSSQAYCLCGRHYSTKCFTCQEIIWK